MVLKTIKIKLINIFNISVNCTRTGGAVTFYLFGYTNLNPVIKNLKVTPKLVVDIGWNVDLRRVLILD
jgi:hypothetical protein